jgi:uncharacterized membrane protein
MSSRGRIAGSLQNTLGRDHAMTWTHSYGMKDIGTLPGGQIARAWAANNYGEVVGESALKDPAVFHPFVWTYGCRTQKTGIAKLACQPHSRALRKRLPGTVLSYRGRYEMMLVTPLGSGVQPARLAAQFEGRKSSTQFTG